MGYTLQAIIGRAEDLAGGSDAELRMILLAQGYGMWPVGVAVRARFGIGVWPLTGDAQEAGEGEIPAGILELAGRVRRCAYVEAEMFGGAGLQAQIYFEEGRAVDGVVVGRDAINGALRRLGLVVIGRSWVSDFLRRAGLQSGTFVDEFEAVGLGRFRATEDWVNAG